MAWQEPLFDGNSRILNYNLMVKRGSATHFNWTGPNTNSKLQVNVTNLEPFTTYTFYVAAINKMGRSSNALIEQKTDSEGRESQYLRFSFLRCNYLRFSFLRYNCLRFSFLLYNYLRFSFLRYNYVHFSFLRYNYLRFSFLRYNYVRFSFLRYNCLRFSFLRYNYLRFSFLRYNYQGLSDIFLSKINCTSRPTGPSLCSSPHRFPLLPNTTSSTSQPPDEGGHLLNPLFHVTVPACHMCCIYLLKIFPVSNS